MGQPLYDLAQDLAVARGSQRPDEPDPDSRFLRRRIASMVWVIGVFAVWIVSLWLKGLFLGVAGSIVLIAGLWLYAERPAWFWTLGRHLLAHR